MNRPQAFSPAAIARAQPITLLCLDVDGVLTDGHLIYTADGQEAKAFNSQDGAAIKLAQRQGGAGHHHRARVPHGDAPRRGTGH